MPRLLVVASAALMLSGCAAVPQRDSTIMLGASVGAGVGALIGSASGGPPGGWAGAAIGAVSGGVIGSMVGRDACYVRNRSGELWQVSCEAPRARSDVCFVGNSPGNLSQVPCWHR